MKKHFNIKAITTGFLSENNRPALIIAGVFLCVAIIVVSVVVYILAPSQSGGIDVTAPTVGGVAKPVAEYSDEYKKAVREKNLAIYNEQAKAEGGVAIPFVSGEFKKQDLTDPSGDINACGCTMSDEQFRQMLSRAGVETTFDSGLNQRIGDSDVYISTKRMLMGDDDKPLLYKGAVLKVNDAGLLLDTNGIAIVRDGIGQVYLSKTGQFIDTETRKVLLKGDILSNTGIAYLSNGLKVIRAGNMQREGQSDLYTTLDGQVVTLDGRPTRHAGAFVFKNIEKELTNVLDAPIRWEAKPVYQNRDGHLVDNANNIFKTPGILFSYNGILIDNLGVLTEPLRDLRKVGVSDILVDDSNQLRDAYGKPVLHYGKATTVGAGNMLFTPVGLVSNPKGSSIYLSKEGRITTDVGQGYVQTGILKDSVGVAYDKFGQLINRVGKLSQKGTSEIYLSSDGLVADKLGTPYLFRTKDMFIDFNAYLPNGSLGLKTYLEDVVTDMNGERVYLDEKGQFVTKQGALAKIGVTITDSNSVVMDALGVKIFSDNAMDSLTTGDGAAVYYQGEPVLVGANGQLYDAKGQPILNDNGSPLFLNEFGVIVDDKGTIQELGKFTSKEGGFITNSGLSARHQLIGASAPALFHNGKAVFERNGRMVYADGTVVTDKNGNPLSPEDIAKQGSQIFYKGQPVFEREGKMYYANGEQVVDSSGKHLGLEDVATSADTEIFHKGQRVFYQNGALVDSQGKVITKATGVPLGLSEIIGTETGIFYKGKPVFERDGKMVYEDGTPVVDSNGKQLSMQEIATSKDAMMFHEGKRVFLKDGNIVDANGDIVRNRDGKAVVLSDLNRTGPSMLFNGVPVYEKDGKLVYGDGTTVVDKDGNALTKADLVKQSSQLFYKGKPVINKAGKLFYADGREVFDDNGQHMSAKSLATSADGELYFEGKKVFFKDGKIVDENGNIVRDKAGKAITLDDVLEAPNAEVYYDEKRVFLKDGVLIHEDGNAVTSAQGERLSLGELTNKRPSAFYKGRAVFDNNGQLVYADGSIVSDDTGHPLSMRDLASNTNQIYYKGKPVFEKNGKMQYADGSAVLDADGNHMSLQDVAQSGDATFYHKGEEMFLKDGQLVRADGSVVTNATGIPLSLSELANTEGVALYHNGKQVFLKDGAIVDENGNIALGDDGQPLTLADLAPKPDAFYNGNPLFMKNGVLHYSDGSIARNAAGAVLTALDIATPLDSALSVNGKTVYEQDGKLVYEDGSPVIDQQGNQLLIDEQGVIRNVFGREVILSPNIKGPFKKGAELVTTQSGEAVTYNGKKVFKQKDGTLIDEDGNFVLTRDGRKVIMRPNGQLVDEKGNVVDEPLLYAKNKPVENGNFKAVSAKQANTKIGSITVTKDGYLLDSEGKAITYNGQPVRKGVDGKLYDAKGNAIKDSKGNFVFLNDAGEFVDKNNNKIEESLFENGQGQLLYSNGKPVTTQMRRIGSSDLYTTKDGRVVDASGKAFLHNGKAVKIGSNGALYTLDGNEVRDTKGNAVYLTEDGEMINKQGELATRMILTTSTGKTVNASGKDIKDRLTKVPGTDHYQSEEGLLVDAQGNPLMIGDKPIYINKGGELVDSQDRPIRYKGQRISFNKDGEIVGTNGDVITMDDGRAMTIDKIDDKSNVTVSNVTPPTKSTVEYVGDVNAKTTGNNSAALITPVPDKGTVPRTEPPASEAKTVTDTTQGKPVIVTSTLTTKQRQRINEMFSSQLSNMQTRAATITSEAARVYTSTSDFLPVVKASAEVASTGKQSDTNGAKQNGEPSSNNVITEIENSYAAPGDSLYAYVNQSVNTDLNKTVELKLVGQNQHHPLFNAIAYGSIQLVYDNAVLSVNRICPVKKPCVSMNGIAIDPVTGSASVGADVDTHFWYRHGGLFLSAFAQGVGENISATADRTTTASQTETTTVYGNLKAEEVAIAGLGQVGTSFAPKFAEQYNRPPTVKMLYRDELVIKVMDYITP